MHSKNEGRRSQATISTIEEISTPLSGNRDTFEAHQVGIRRAVEGPRGPHLFRSSYSSSEMSFDFALQLSPLTPKRQELRIDTAVNAAPDGTPTSIHETPAAVPNAGEDWDQDEPRSWTSQQVAMWMCNSGMDAAIVEKFEFHDITGTVLLDLQFQDLKELGIQSFGKRHQVWNQICSLRGGDGCVSPVPTPFQDIDRPASNLSRTRSQSRNKSQDKAEDDCVTPITPGTGKRRRRKHRRNGDEPITPAESVSIVAIEQLIPKPHKCSKGENCSKWKKQQRLLRRLQEEHGIPVSPEKGGRIFIAGDPGNAATAPAIVDNAHMFSDNEQSTIGPSVVASSDLLGPGEMPAVALHEDALKRVEERDPQENVKNFLTLQRVEPPALPSPLEDSQPSPTTLEMFPMNYQQPPTAQHPLSNLQSLPRLTIPHANTFPQMNPYSADFSAYQTAFHDNFSPCRTAVPSPPTIDRFATPASDMDVPVTAIPLDPYARETTSQSVPPNMHFRDPVPRSRVTSRRPSMPLPHINEGEIFSPTAFVQSHGLSNRSSSTYSGDNDLALSPKAASDGDRTPNPRDFQYANVAHHGWMKKRKTKLLRHEWHDHHFRLAGTQLAMHASDHPSSSALDTLNIDEYAVACSSVASNKLSAKLKALKLSDKDAKLGRDEAKFLFQLVPTAEDGTEKGALRRAVDGAKTHHFAVRSRDERIDWMRELMLAKALRAKKDGYAVEVNGSQV
jgi:hypothetical protein